MTIFFDAFISYGRADSKAFAQELQARLDKQGFRVWFDFNDIPLAVDFQNQIDDGIEKANHFLFIISPHSINSPYCRKELELAIKLNKRIIPLLHVKQISQETWHQRNPNGKSEDWQAYKAKGLHDHFQNMHPKIRKLNWVYFQEEIDDFEKSLADLINLLRSHTDYVEQHTRFLVKGLEWKRHQKQTIYLLIGAEKQQAKVWLKTRLQDEQPPCTPTDLHCEYITESIKNANNLMTQVIISYSDEDRTTMETIRQSLRRESITVWTNRTDIQTGEEFEAAIKRGIEQADNLVYLLSPDSVKSNFAQRELNYALSLNKRIIPVLVRQTPPEQVPSALRDLQYINLTDKVKDDDYRLNLCQLLKILHQDAAYYNEHKILLTKALKWKRQHENPSILLRGYNLQSAETWLKVAQTRTQHPPTILQEEFISASLQQLPLESLDVFISYSRADSDLARKLNDALQMQGKMTWFDQESIASGSDFQQEICRGIKACDNFLFILSPRSVNSPYCASEVEYAASLHKRFVTVLHQEVNTADLHPELAKVQWIDFNQNQRDFNANFNQLVRTIDTDREHVRHHSKWLQKAIEWDAKGHDDSFLLRGSNLQDAQQWLQEWLKSGASKQPEPTTLQTEYLVQSYKEETNRVEAEKARKQAEFYRQKAKIKLQRIALGSVSLAFLVASSLGVAAFYQWKRAAKVTEGQINALSRFSLVLAKSNQGFDALLAGIRAKGLLTNLPTVKPEVQSSVLTALQVSVYGEGFREYNRLTRHRDGVTSVAFSPDGKTIASASDDGIVKLWNLDGQELQTLYGHQNWVRSVTFSPDGKILASASDDGVKLWNLQGKLLHTLYGHQNGVYSVAFSPDGKLLACASDNGTIKLWNLHSQERQTLQGHQDGIRSVAFSPDGKLLASASDNGTIKLWNLNGQPLQTLQGHQDGIRSVAFSPDGKTIASASLDNTVKLWNLDGQRLQTLQGHQNWVYSVAFSPDGKTIASASLDNTVKLWNLDGQRLQILQGHPDKVRSVSFSPDGKILASASNDTSVKLWNLQGKLLHTLYEHQHWVTSVAFSSDGKTIASASLDNTVKLWNLQGELMHTLQGHESDVASVAFNPDGKTIASASLDNTVKLWNLDGQELQTLYGHGNWVYSVAFSPDGKTIASASADSTVKLWNLDGQELQTLYGHKNRVYSVAFSPDGKTIASASEDNTVNLWNLQGELLQTLQGHQDGVTSVAFSPDSKTLVSGSMDNTIKLWNLKGEMLQTLKGHQDWVYSVAFSPDGKTLASGSYDKTVILWNLADLTLYSLMEDACDWVGDYLKYNAPKSDRTLCD